MPKGNQRSGCGVSARGKATIARDRRLSPGNPATVKGSPARRAANTTVHCDSTNPFCPNTDTFNETQKK